MKSILFAILAFVPFVVSAQIQSHKQTFVGGTLQLQDYHDLGFGTWTSLATGTATVGSASGIVTGVARGTASIVYARGSFSDTTSVYVSTSDSSGYYFEATNQLQKRDCDGKTILAIWSGTDGGSKVTYSSNASSYSIIFSGWVDLDGSKTLQIKSSDIKDFSGTAKKSTADSVVTQILSYKL